MYLKQQNKNMLRLLLLLSALALASSTAWATAIQFGSFSQAESTTNKPFHLTTPSTGAPGAGNAGSLSSSDNNLCGPTYLTTCASAKNGIAVSFSYNDVNLFPELTGNIAAHMTVTAVVNQAGTKAGSVISQKVVSGTIAIIMDTPASIGHTGSNKNNLVTMAFTNALITGTQGANTATFKNQSSGSTITYTSDFYDFSAAGGTSKSFQFALSAVTFEQLWGATGTSYEKSFDANVSGNFTADPAPTNDFVYGPEPGSILLMSCGGLFLFGVRRMRARKA